VSGRELEIVRLRRGRPRSPFRRLSALLLLALAVLSWTAGGLFDEPVETRGLASFLSELRPYEQRGKGEGVAGAARWAGDRVRERGAAASAATLAISVASIVLAGAVASILAWGAARTLATPEPFLQEPSAPHGHRRALWSGLVALTRLFLVFLRAIPEYIWAFLFVAMLGPGAWPAVLALGIHNAGILGKLGGETIENLEPAPLAALRALGATRAQMAVGAVMPIALPRFLLYFFYRWETCVREATVLGMLGIPSLGFWIDDARNRRQFDRMFFYILLGAAIVLLGDLVSALARRIVRRG
jgi:phosphonate transport system permease protein